MMKPFLLAVLFFFNLSAHAGTTITFNDGFASLTWARYAYTSQGIELPGMKLFNVTSGVPFFYGSDEWGIVRDGSFSPPETIIFLTPVNYVEIDARGQSALDLNGAQPFQSTLQAFDGAGNEVDSSSVFWGTDLIVPEGTYGRTFGGSGYPLGNIYLRVESPEGISRVSLNCGRKCGIDTLRFGVVTSVPEPETYAMMLAGLGLVGAAVRRRRN